MICLCLFRRDLRLTDNPALQAAAAAGRVLPVFWIDPVLKGQGAATRWRVERSVRALDADLRRRGAVLAIVEGDARALVALARAVEAVQVHACDWPEPARQAADGELAALLAAEQRSLVLHDGHTLLPPGAVRTGQGTPFKVFTPFARAARRLGVAPPRPAPTRIAWAEPPVGWARPIPPFAADMNRGAAVVARHSPEAGESAALDRLRAFRDRAAGYAGGRDRPDRPEAGSGLSDALAVGELSPRTVWAAAEAMEDEAAMAPSAAKFMGELLWRDFAWSLLSAHPEMAQAPWRADWTGFPYRENPDDLAAWQRARTGEPLVDAGLREMFVTGRMHNRVRMIVASYLTKHLLLDWRAGLAWFADTLIDWDPASNAMNWQWVAGSGPDASPFFRIFNPAAQAERFDPDGTYRRRWLYGWQGSRSADALAWFDAVPRSWGLSPDAPYPDRPVVLLDAGRRRALDALARSRPTTPPG